MKTFAKSFVDLNLFWLYSGLFLICVFAAVVFELPIILIVPVFVVGTYLTIQDFRIPFYLLMIAIPFSTEIVLGGGIGMDFPSEIVMLLVLGLLFFIIAAKPHLFDPDFFKNPICL